jgi:hypothetical protein
MRMTTSLRAALITALMGLGAAAQCVAADEDWAAARERWRAANLAGYEYGYQKYCECHPDAPPETVVTVRSGEVVAVRHRPQGSSEEVRAEERNLQFYWTVDGLFGLLQSAIDRGVQVRAQYHETLGHPTQIYIDYDPEFIGDELDLRLTRVVALR